MRQSKTIILAAAGTAGHINSALALGDYFKNKGYDILYLAGKRELDFKLYAKSNVIFLDSKPLRYKNPIKIIISLLINFKTFLWLMIFYFKKKPLFVFGAGGYICGPTLLAAFFLRIPTYILEQNSVMGLANKLIVIFANKIFVSFGKTMGLKEKYEKKVIVSGNPLRGEFYTDFKKVNDNKQEMNILIFGGSLGALAINQFVEEFVAGNFEELDFKINIKHQIGHLNKEEINKENINSKINYQPMTYLPEIVKDYMWSDLIVSRGGASTVAELERVSRPVILIPAPVHRDRHQFHNAEDLKKRVGFPVYIHNIEDFKGQNINNFVNIVKTEFDNKISQSGEMHSSKTEVDPRDIIFKEVIQNV